MGGRPGLWAACSALLGRPDTLPQLKKNFCLIFLSDVKYHVMFRVQQGPPAPPPINTRFAIINSIYNNPFHWSVFKGLIGFAAGVVIARTVSDEWANSV
ncbi:hypothetical protein Y032_0127g1380 [Ancylostoma ceylanicum]|uniref:Uncharacterized protein n=1 Tax=Ancylostoma ceylanicum TaxID=53326 RepID=A0A016T812_9BILA|nr:hypothetical protein Y032_0127g1380 [Ancylostoma ceylanicum]